MSKAYLIMDMPKSCIFCPLSDWANCRITKNCHTADSRADDCPLRELPSKIGIEEALRMPRSGCISDVVNSYNACIDEIMGGSEENG